MLEGEGGMKREGELVETFNPIIQLNHVTFMRLHLVHHSYHIVAFLHLGRPSNETLGIQVHHQYKG